MGQPKIPKTLGACADRLHLIDLERAVLNKQLDTLRDEERLIEERLIQTLPKSDAGGVEGKLARASIRTKQVPTVKDWDALYARILKEKDFSYLQKRVSESAVKERWEAGEQVPGVEAFTVVKVSVNKLRS